MYQSFLSYFVFRIGEILCVINTQDEFHLPLSHSLHFQERIRFSIRFRGSIIFLNFSILDGLIPLIIFFFIPFPFFLLRERVVREGEAAVVLNFTGSPIAISV